MLIFLIGNKKAYKNEQKNLILHFVFVAGIGSFSCFCAAPDFVNVSPKNHLQIMGRYVDVVS